MVNYPLFVHPSVLMITASDRRKPDKQLQALGDRVRQLRETRRWSQEELADRARIHVTYLSGIERARRNPTFKVLCTLANALGVRLSQLFGTTRLRPRP
jgi:transcriptional regulator with XRE-family HTH domain